MKRNTERSVINLPSHKEDDPMIWGLDTETDNDGKDHAWIVQWALVDPEGHGKAGETLEQLEEALIHLGGRMSGKHYIYIHNLKYDLEFIKYAIYNIKLRYDGTINAIIRKGSPVSITLIFAKKTLIFRDSMKKWQGDLRSMGKAYGLEKLDPPGDEDFSPGWSEKVDFSKKEAFTYVIRDAQICAFAMSQMHGANHSKSTTSGDAWKDMHRVINGDFTRPGMDRWSQLFPPLKYDLYKQLCHSYFGGINISEHRGEVISGDITHEDRVSMYPSVMWGTEGEELPYGMPIYIGEQVPPDDVLYITRQRIKLQIKDNRIAWFMFKSGLDYAIEGMEFGTQVHATQEWHELTLTSVDLYNLSLDYDVEIDPMYKTETWIFKSEVGILRPYIDKWIKVKKEAPKGSAEREHAKRMLNAAYGRFALIQESELIELVEDDETQDLEWLSRLTVSSNDAYLPMAAFVTAYARLRLMDRVRMVCDTYGADAVIHSDTDSVIYKGKPIGLHGKELGDWDIEAQPLRIFEGGFKRYIEDLGDHHYKMACAGVPQRSHRDGCPQGMWIELLDDPYRITGAYTLGSASYKIQSEWLRKKFTDTGRDPDHVNTLKLIPRKVQGGVILEGRQHELSDNMKWRFNRAL